MNQFVQPLRAGGAGIEITPRLERGHGPYLTGYPYAERHAEVIHDPLFASSLYLHDGRSGACFVSCDLLYVPGDLAARARRRIADALRLPVSHVMLTATHTHSGPLTVRLITHEADPTVPPSDADYLRYLEDHIVESACRARDYARPARLAYGEANGAELGGNRRDPSGPSHPRMPVLVARARDDDRTLAAMVVCSMHPTVLHEDSGCISGDFPGLARRWLHEHLGRFPLIHHMGASGNQSPRHVVRGNTIEEAYRLGHVLAQEIRHVAEDASNLVSPVIRCEQAFVALPAAKPPEVEAARAAAKAAEAAWRGAIQRGESRAVVRTAEVDWFGKRKALALAEAAEAGLVAKAVADRSPAEVQVIAIGPHAFVGWPGEVFVEFALDVVESHPEATIITLANGELHGYLVTQAAKDEGGYEASHALFDSPASGRALVTATLDLLGQINLSTASSSRPG